MACDVAALEERRDRRIYLRPGCSAFHLFSANAMQSREVPIKRVACCDKPCTHIGKLGVLEYSHAKLADASSSMARSLNIDGDE
jgi:hypothetical protein